MGNLTLKHFHYFVLFLAGIFLTLPTCVFAAGITQSASMPEKQCNIGPLNRTYGKTPWLVYSCDDNSSLVIITASGSPAAPFYFTFFPEGAKYRLYGEGDGKKELTDSAYEEIKGFTERDIKLLIEQTKKVKGQ